jgi:hypothetical protein
MDSWEWKKRTSTHNREGYESSTVKTRTYNRGRAALQRRVNPLNQFGLQPQWSPPPPLSGRLLSFPVGRQCSETARNGALHHPICEASMNTGEPARSAQNQDQNQNQNEDEARRIRRLQVMMSMVASVISQDPSLTVEEASELAAGAKRAALAMFPDKELAYDLLYKPRLQRLMRERYRLQ